MTSRGSLRAHFVRKWRRPAVCLSAGNKLSSLADSDAETYRTSAQLRRLNIPLKDLPAANSLPRLEVAQRFLRSAHASVRGLFTNLAAMRGLSLEKTSITVQTRGALGESQVDLLRAAVVFSAAGVDATLKQPVREGLPGLLAAS